jgi:hypothetical protein
MDRLPGRPANLGTTQANGHRKGTKLRAFGRKSFIGQAEATARLAALVSMG